MSNIANSVLIQKPNKSTHNLTCETKTTGNLGQLIPVYLQEVVPGDQVDLNAQFLTKFQPMLKPAMQNFNAYVHYFYVPFRALWKNFKYFIAQTPEPGGTVPPLHPMIEFINASEVTHGVGTFLTGEHNLAPYFGINKLYASGDITVNAFPFLAYQHIWNEYYRHEKIHADLTPDLILPDGTSTLNPEWNKVRYRTYKDDYFTAGLPSPQLGNEATLDIQGLVDLPVLHKSTATINTLTTEWASQTKPNNAVNTTHANNDNNTTGSGITANGLWVKTSSLDGTISANDLIELQRMQEFLVRNNLAGNRYNEFIMAHFGVRVPDLRLDRPDYICGIKAPVIISEVLNMANAQGTQTGQGNAFSEGGRGNYEVLEHGIIMGIYSCIPTQSYTTAVQRFMYKNNPMDYYLPVFDQMGEREILNEELAIDHIDPKGTFAYVPQYAEYRLPFNACTGEFATTLTQWHLAQILPSTVVLNDEFFDINKPDRVFIVDSSIADCILIQVMNQVYISRPMNKYSMPTLTNEYGNNLY